MRAAFTLLILALSAFYTYWAFVDLSFLSSMGRLGPGFFPRIIGILLIVACLAELAFERFRGAGEAPDSTEYAGTVVLLGALTGLFVVAMIVFGALIAMIAFMLATLMVLNRAHPVQNIAIAVVLPTAIWLLFEVWLNAATPPGLLFDEWLA